MCLYTGGYARIGASPAPIVGPYISGSTCSFIVSFGVPSNPSGDRKIYKIDLDNELAWASAGGGTVPADGTFYGDPFDFIFKPGTLTQTACSLETTYFAGDENAYRPQMLLQILDIPIARFMAITGKPVPYVACEIGDCTDGADPLDFINLGEALERIARSPWCGYTAANFETTGVTDVVDAILIKDNFTMVQLCQNVAGEYRNLDVLTSDKLRVKDRGSSVTPDIVFDRDSIIGDDNAVSVIRGSATAQRREHELIAIDPDQDYTAVPSLAKIPRDPMVISVAVGKQTVTSPLVIDADTRQALATFSQQYQENARRRVAFKALAIGYGIEPGDLFALTNIADGFDNEVFKCTQTSHGANWVVDIEGEAILRCSIYAGDFDPHIGSVVLLLHMNGSVGSTAFFDSSSYVHDIEPAFGNAQVSASAKFGTGALVCDGTSDGIMTQNATTLNDVALSATNTSPYTIECWANFDAVNRAQVLVAIDGGALSRSFRLWQNGDDELQFLWGEDPGGWANQLDTTAANITTATWHFIAVDKDSTGKLRIYVNGVMKAGTTPADSTIGVTAERISVGSNALSGGSFLGRIDEVRITRGVSRYGDVYGDASFSPPGDQFPDT